MRRRVLQKLLNVTIGLQNQIFFRDTNHLIRNRRYIMTKRILALASLAALLAFGSETQAAQQSATASATIVTAVSIANTSSTPLAFGTIAPGAALGTVTVSPAGVRSFDGGVSLVNSGTVSAAPFAITGTGSLVCNITMPTSISIGDGASHSMTVDTFTSSLPVATTVTLSSGAASFSVGGTLHVAASQPAGSYTGTFDVSVAYN